MLSFHGPGPTGSPRRVVALPGTFNPPTIAHLSMAIEAASRADAVVLLLPERLPHKQDPGASFQQRLEMLLCLAEAHRFLVCSSAAGLYVEMARLLRQRFPGAELALACGADAARRTVAWTYEDPEALSLLFSLAHLWVFARGGHWKVPHQWAHAVQCLDFDENLQSLSATEVRHRIEHGHPWQHLVPRQIHPHVERIYRPALPFPATAMESAAGG